MTAQSVEALLDGVLMVVYLAILLVYDVQFGALVLLVAVAQFALLFGTSRRTRQLQHRHLLAQARTQSMLVQLLEGIATVKASGSEERLLRLWRERLDTELAAKQRSDRLTGTVDNAGSSLRMLAPLATLWLGVHQLIAGTTGLGAMIALQTLTMSVLLPMSSVATTVQRLQSLRGHLQRVQDILEASPERPQQTSRASRLRGDVDGDTPELRGGIELRDVTFAYSAHATPAVREVSLSVEPGSTVAIVGASGSGKSTLALLMLGLYTPTSGEVLYDGVPAADLDHRALRRRVGVVLQDSFVFGDTIRGNLTLTNPELAHERMLLAAQVADIDDDIRSMPMRYETRIGEGGKLVSGGQRQRIALARALANDPAILFLDEATSHLDAVTEQRITTRLAGLGCTRIVIAHRLSTVRAADEILVLDRGRLVERGPHEQLLAQGGVYTALIGAQSSHSGRLSWVGARG